MVLRRLDILDPFCIDDADEKRFLFFRETLTRWRVGGDQWVEYVKTAWSTDPRIAMGLVARFPGVNMLRAEVSSLVQVCCSI